MLNYYQLKIKGIKKAVSELKANLPKNNTYYSGIYMQVNFDTNSGKILTNYHYSLGHNSWTVYHDKAVIFIGNYIKPAKMQEIINDIAQRLTDLNSEFLSGYSDFKDYNSNATKKFIKIATDKFCARINGEVK